MPSLSPLQALRARHQSIARALADGESTSAIAARFNMPLGDIERLSGDPAFRDLVQRYRDAERGGEGGERIPDRDADRTTPTMSLSLRRGSALAASVSRVRYAARLAA